MYRKAAAIIFVSLSLSAQKINLKLDIEDLQFEERKPVHTYNESGYLIIDSKIKLESYVRRAKTAFMECFYFEKYYPENYQYLKNNNLTVDFISAGTVAENGHVLGLNVCGEWAYLRDKSLLYFKAVKMNRKRKTQEEKKECTWESTIPHEVLHASYLLHSDNPDDLKYYKHHISFDEFDNILINCDLSFLSTMDRWWIIPFEEAREVPDFEVNPFTDLEKVKFGNEYND